MKRVAITLLHAVGLEQPARRAKDHISSAIWRLRWRAYPYGFGPWQPLVPESEFYRSCADAIKNLRAHFPDHKFGDYMEFGVSRDTSLACMNRALDDAGLDNVRIFGFDSFKGLPPEAASELTSEFWAPGAFRSTLGAN